MKAVFFLLGTVLALAVASKGPLQINLRHGGSLASIPKAKAGHRAAKLASTRAISPDISVTSYHVQLTPILETTTGQTVNTVLGNVIIVFQHTGTAPMADFIINAFSSVDISSALIDSGLLGVDETAGVLRADDESVTITPATPLEPSTPYRITMVFTTVINQGPDHLYGIYRSEFPVPDPSGGPPTQSPMATTQFEPTGAREAFPCFDEPAYKARFTLDIGHLPSYRAFANAPLIQTRVPEFPPPPTGYVLSSFEASPVMSSYLVAFVVAKRDDYACVKDDDTDLDIDVQVCGPKHLTTDLNGGLGGGFYAAKQSFDILEHYDTFTGIPYQPDKMYSMAIDDFSAGAMENWGLNTYRVPLLLNYGDESTARETLRTNQILVHELIHQWFGNLVTCSFWDQIWMNEGFATYFEYEGVADNAAASPLMPTGYQQFDAVQRGLEFDAGPESHPVINDHTDKDEDYEYYGDVFTPVSYEKAGSLLKMIEELVTAEVLEAAMKTYLTTFAGRVATQEDFFTIVEAAMAAKLPPIELGPAGGPYYSLTEIMKTWTYQSGFPLLRVHRATSRRIYVSQERYSPTNTYWTTPAVGTPLRTEEYWTIPLKLVTPDGTGAPAAAREEWLDKSVLVKNIEFTTGDGAISYVHLNPTGTGFYRVHYLDGLLDDLTEAFVADHTNFDEKARSQLIDDYFVFAKESRVPVADTLAVTRYLEAEDSSLVWHTAVHRIGEFYGKLLGDAVPPVGGAIAAHTELTTYLTTKLGTLFGSAGNNPILDDNDAGAVKTKKSLLLDLACTLKMAICTGDATTEFDAWQAGTSKIPVDVRSTYFCSAVTPIANQDRYDYLWGQYQLPTTLDADKSRMINAFACSEQPTNIVNLLTEIKATAAGVIETGHKGSLLSALAANSVIGRETTVTDFLANPLLYIEAVKEGGVLDFYQTLSNFALEQGEITALDAVLDLTPATNFPTLLPQLEAAVGEIQKTLDWRTANEVPVAAWLSTENNP